MMYAAGQQADEDLHAVYHKKSLQGVYFQVGYCPEGSDMKQVEKRVSSLLE